MKCEFRSLLLYVAVGSVSDTRACVAGKVSSCLWLNSGTVIFGTTALLIAHKYGCSLLLSTGNGTPLITYKSLVRVSYTFSGMNYVRK
jgi:hypothetical protein